MNYGRHRLDDACSREFGKVWTWLVVNRAALNQSDLALPDPAPNSDVGGFGENMQRPTGWRETLGGWRRQNLTRQLCDQFFGSLRNREAKSVYPREGSAVSSASGNELGAQQVQSLAVKPQTLRLEDLLPESALKRVALPQTGQTLGLRSLLAKAA